MEDEKALGTPLSAHVAGSSEVADGQRRPLGHLTAQRQRSQPPPCRPCPASSPLPSWGHGHAWGLPAVARYPVLSLPAVGLQGRRGGREARAGGKRPTGPRAGRRARRQAPALGDARASSSSGSGSSSSSSKGQCGRSHLLGPPRDPLPPPGPCRKRDGSFTELEPWRATWTHTLHTYMGTHTHTQSNPHVQTWNQQTCKHVYAHTHKHKHTYTLEATGRHFCVPRTSWYEQGREVDGSSLPGRGSSNTRLVCDAPCGQGAENISRRPGPAFAEGSLQEEPVGPAPCGRQEPEPEDCSAFPAV